MESIFVLYGIAIVVISLIVTIKYCREILMNHKDIKVSKVKKYCAFCLFLIGILICLYSWWWFFSELFSGEYRYHEGWNVILLVPLLPLFGAVIAFLTGRCLIGKNKWYAPILGGIISFCLLFIPYNIELSPIDPEIEKIISDRKSRETRIFKLKYVARLENARELIDGTTWHYTENLSSSKIGFWVKVSFNNGQATSYYANPSDGKWTKSKENVNYQIEEGRYSNTGERYIAVKWKGQDNMGLPCNYALILGSFQLAVQSALPDLDTFKMLSPDYGTMEFGDYEWH